MAKQRQSTSEKGSPDSDQLAIFRDTFASFNHTIKRLNESYGSLQERYQQLSDELTATNERLRETLELNIQTKNFLENILESLTAGVITVDLDGKVNSVNRAGCAILKVNAEELIGKSYCTLFDRSLAGDSCLCDLLSGGGAFRNVEKDVRIGADTVIPISVSTAPITDSSGNTVGALEVFVDLTEVKQMQEEMARVKSLAALGEVAAVIAHEVRNPLSGIAGFAALLRDELGNDHPNISYVDRIIAGVQKLNRSVTSLLEYARDLRHQPQPSDLKALLTETVEFFRMDLHTRNSPSQVELRLPDEPVVCHVDRENLGGALVNLLKNADEAMPKGGTIHVTVDSEPDRIRLSIADHGTAIPEELREKIFVPFFTTREGGTGLGLALVKKVVDAHRGTIAVNSHDGGGSVFRIELPAEKL
jgi:PAS domain S-box-containing protein